MAKVVVYTCLIIAFVVFLVRYPNKRHDGDEFAVISRRLGYNLALPTFDPLVSEMKRVVEENKSSNHQTDLEKDARNIEVEDDCEYFSSKQGRLNITLRLLYLFPLIDNGPKDGVVSVKELEDWNIEQAVDRLNYKTEKEIDLHDKDEDQAISFEEFFSHFSKEDIEKNGTRHGEAGWWTELFMNADVDGNGVLNFDEFNNFLHPEDSNIDAIRNSLLAEKMEEMDDDSDGKLDFEEFAKTVYDTYKTCVEFEVNRTNIPTPEEKFAELDVNKDKFLQVEELKPMFSYLQPGEVTYAKYYSNYLIQEADDDEDGSLTLDEMLKHPYIFYSTVYDNVDDEDEDDYYLHDEL